MVICITGKIGSGKSTVARLLSERLGWRVIDVDGIGHEILERDDVKEKIVEIFGENVVRCGRVDRSRLRKIVFEDEDNLKRLEKLLHPLMVEEILNELRWLDNAIIDCALLERMKLLNLCDLVITVISSYEISRSRKPGLSDEEFESIWNSQRDVRPIGILIENNGDLETLEENVKRLMEHLEISPRHRTAR